jgi:hypothetical protein
MTDKENPKPQHLERLEKGGYQPLNEGYTPLGQRGYVPDAQILNQIPPLPQGGTAQSPTPVPETPKK